MNSKLVITGSIFILIAIILGALGAHSIEKIVSADLLASFEKGVKYQIYMGLALLAIGLNAEKISFKLNTFYWFVVVGTLLFSGGIYGYTFHEQIPSIRFFAHIVPFGGTSMIVAWCIFTFNVIKTRR
jgi:uncharacterized membrane protein YgdD (TMEM256/DUF423 family)